MVSFPLLSSLSQGGPVFPKTCILLACGRDIRYGSSVSGPPLQHGLLTVLHDQAGEILKHPCEFFDIPPIKTWSLSPPLEPGQAFVTASRGRTQ